MDFNCGSMSVGFFDEDKCGPLHNGSAGANEEDIDIFDLAFASTPEACNAPSIICHRPWMRPVLRLPPKVFRGSTYRKNTQHFRTAPPATPPSAPRWRPL
jgi:hypothetical protein